MKELSIGQMARLNGLSEQMLRLYDKAGLFSPMYRDAENGYRYYDIRQSAQLDMIQHMKALGMSLKDIREQMTHFELDMFKTILHRNLEELELRSRELMYQRRAIERTLESYEWYENAPPDGTIVLEYIPRRLTYMTDSGVNFYDYLMEGRYYSTEIFVLVDRGFVNDSLITEIPASTYLCIYCNGFEREKEYMGRLVEEIRTKDYQVTGDYICEVVAEVPMDMQERGMFLCLQVPVSFRKNNP